MKKIFLLSIIILLASVVAFPWIEDFLIDQSVLWTIARITPYFLVIVLGFSSSFLFYKNFSFDRNWQKYFITGLIFAVPFLIGFALKPIYQGDFSRGGVEVKFLGELESYADKTFIVLTIPDCPYCLESIRLMNKLKQRNPSLKITYIVCGEGTTSAEDYKKAAVKGIQFKSAKNVKDVSHLADYSFPSFIYLKDNKGIKWSNNDIGPLALDFIESDFVK